MEEVGTTYESSIRQLVYDNGAKFQIMMEYTPG